MEDMVMNEGRS